MTDKAKEEAKDKDLTKKKDRKYTKKIKEEELDKVDGGGQDGGLGTGHL